MITKNTVLRFAITLIIMSIFYSCKKDQVEKVVLPQNNQWILDSMKVYYYWNQQLPVNPASNTSATTFFKSILNPADRFSYLENPDEIKTDYSSFAWYGFEYALIQHPLFPDQLTGIVTLVVPGGPADQQGLKRGYFFDTVNGITITNATIPVIKQLLEQGNGIQLNTAVLTNNHLQEKGNISISYVRYQEQPVYTTRIFNTGGKKTGYIFYNWFGGNYDYNILDSLGKLRSAGVSELILDLRYNPGGDVSSAAKIAATLTNTKDNQVFAIYQANQNGGRANKTFHQLITENSYQPQSFSELENRRLNLSKVIILTTGATASAAELLINALKPYIQVIQIGQATMGKDMASFAINDQRKPKIINITLHLLIFKLYNASGKGDYQNGLTPDYIIDEFSDLPLKPFGDPQDPFIKKALNLIEGETPSSSARLNAKLNLNKSYSAKPLYQSTVEHSRFSKSIAVKNTFDLKKQ